MIMSKQEKHVLSSLGQGIVLRCETLVNRACTSGSSVILHHACGPAKLLRMPSHAGRHAACATDEPVATLQR